MSEVMKCIRCGDDAVWIDGMQFGSSKCTCPCHKDITTEEAS